MLLPVSQFEGLHVGCDRGWQLGFLGPGWPLGSPVMPKRSRHGSHSLLYLLQQLVCSPQDLALANARACWLQAAGQCQQKAVCSQATRWDPAWQAVRAETGCACSAGSHSKRQACS